MPDEGTGPWGRKRVTRRAHVDTCYNAGSKIGLCFHLFLLHPTICFSPLTCLKLWLTLEGLEEGSTNDGLLNLHPWGQLCLWVGAAPEAGRRPWIVSYCHGKPHEQDAFVLRKRLLVLIIVNFLCLLYQT